VRFQDETFLHGANNKYTVGRTVDAGHSVEDDREETFVGYIQEVDRDFIAESEESESESEEEWQEESEESEESEEDECESEEGESEEEWQEESEESEEDECEEEECGYWERTPLPEGVFTYNLEDGIWSYYSYVKKINGEYIVTLSDWLDECPDNIYNDDEWLGNMVGKLTDVVFPENRLVDYLGGKFVTEKGWRNVQLPMAVADDDED
tara:strand:+ start:1636 stop:2262 length:627 start_codon:yes stop_codon:yes gene_type:complete